MRKVSICCACTVTGAQREARTFLLAESPFSVPPAPCGERSRRRGSRVPERAGKCLLVSDIDFTELTESLVSPYGPDTMISSIGGEDSDDQAGETPVSSTPPGRHYWRETFKAREAMSKKNSCRRKRRHSHSSTSVNTTLDGANCAKLPPEDKGRRTL